MDTLIERSVIELANVRYTWPGNESPTIDIPHLSIKKGEHLFIKGPSGCGKSTLLSLLTGINTTNDGSIIVLEKELKALSGSSRDRFRAEHIGYIFQQFNLIPYLSVIENVTLPCQFSKRRKAQVVGNLQQHAALLLDKLSLSPTLRSKPVTELSIGQQQRVAAARALIGNPEIIIADEPTSSLDYENRTAFIELLLEQVTQANSTLVFVSHDPTLEPLFDRNLDLRELNRLGGQK